MGKVLIIFLTDGVPIIGIGTFLAFGSVIFGWAAAWGMYGLLEMLPWPPLWSV